MTELMAISAPDIIFECFKSFTETVFLYLFLILFLKKKDSFNKLIVLLLFLMIAAGHIITINFIEFWILRLILSLILDFGFVWVLFQDKWYKCILYTGLFYLFVAMLETAVFSIFNYLYADFNASNILEEVNLQTAIVLIILRLVQFFIVLLIKSFKSREIYKKQWRGLLSMPVITVVFVMFVYPRYFSKGNSDIDMLLILLGIFLVVQNLIVFFYITIVQTSTDRYLEMQDMQERQRQYFATISAIQRTIRKMGHDIRHHFIYLFNALDEGDVSKARGYLIKLDESLDSLIPVNITGHTDVDALLNVKARQAKEHNIQIEVEGRLPPALEMAPVDLSMLLGNALDNAIRAAAQVQGEKVIHAIFVHHENRLSFTISNPYVGRVRRRPGGFFFSHRPGGGMGGEIMQDVVRRYDGFLGVDTKDRLFTLTVLLQSGSLQDEAVLPAMEF